MIVTDKQTGSLCSVQEILEPHPKLNGGGFEIWVEVEVVERKEYRHLHDVFVIGISLEELQEAIHVAEGSEL
jgi:hypothetical protein